MRYVLSVVGLDASKHVRGTHGLLPDADEDAPVFLCSETSVARSRIAATEVRDVLLDLAGVSAAPRAATHHAPDRLQVTFAQAVARPGGIGERHALRGMGPITLAHPSS